MTAGWLENMLREILQEELRDTPDAAKLNVPQLMHIKAGLDRALLDAISDDETPCPHNGSNWPVFNGIRCGMCQRVLEKENVNG